MNTIYSGRSFDRIPNTLEGTISRLAMELDGIENLLKMGFKRCNGLDLNEHGLHVKTKLIELSQKLKKQKRKEV